jgi:serine kinase of HPr protein (carbohydrate metabolism regulator)
MAQAEQQKTIRHGTAVLVPGEGQPSAAVLLRGPSGSGKSDLAFRLIADGATLICDDQVELEKRHERVYAGPVGEIRGLIEVRGVGLLRVPVAAVSPLALVVDLVAREEVPRLPPEETVDILGIALPLLRLHAFDASAVAKLRAAMRVVHAPQLVVR